MFTGDTLFVAGCGNFNTGSPRQMCDAFAKLGALPDSTLVFVGHECEFNAPLHLRPGLRTMCTAHLISHPLFECDCLWTRSRSRRLVILSSTDTASNLDYAAFVEPANQDIKAKRAWTAATRKAGRYTVPTTIGEEKLTNPFLRAVMGESSVLAHAKTKDTVSAMKFVREEKSGGAWKSNV